MYYFRSSSRKMIIVLYSPQIRAGVDILQVHNQKELRTESQGLLQHLGVVCIRLQGYLEP